MRAVLPVRVRLVNETQVGFVHQCRSLHRVARTFTAHVMMSQPAQFFMDQRHQLIKGSPVPVTPGDEQLGYLLW